MPKSPPRILLAMARPFLSSWMIEDVEGDLNELYTERIQKGGRLYANIRYLVDLLTLMNLYKTKFKISSNMKSLAYHHTKTAFRHFKRRKQFFLINVSGLVLALASSMLIALHVSHEFSYDRFHENHSRIVRMALDRSNTSSAPMGPHLVDKIPDIEANTRFSFPFQPLRLQNERQVYSVAELGFADPSFFDIFSFPIVQGSKAGLFTSIDQIAIAEKEATKLFGDADPIGQLLTINDSLDVVIRAVFEDVPSNSHLQFSYLLPFEFLRKIGQPNRIDQWGRFSYYNYFMLTDGSVLAEAESKSQEEITEVFEGFPTPPTPFFQPLDDIHLKSDFSTRLTTAGDLKLIRVYIAAAILIFIIACINYINLSTALISKRLKEIGVRKVLGAYRRNLLQQYFTEAILLMLISLALAMLLIAAVMPWASTVFGGQLSLVFSPLQVAGFAAGVLLLTTTLAGIYPAILFSSNRPVDAIQGRTVTGKRIFRKLLLTSQFTFSLVLLVMTFVTRDQLRFITHFDPGYDRENVVLMPLYGQIHDDYRTIQNELLKSPLIQEVAASASLPINNSTATNSSSLRWEQKDPALPNFTIHINWVDESYLKLFDVELKTGRSFHELEEKTGDFIILNEAAVANMQLEDPIGKKLNLWGQEGRVVGVAKDFNFKSFHQDVEPMMILLERRYFEYAYIKYQNGTPLETIELIEEVARRVDQNYVSNLRFLDGEFQQMYEDEQRTGTLLSLFSGLAIFISIIGLFGFVTFVAQSRMKEISIRKVLGASPSVLLQLITKEFLILIGIASVISWPLAYYLAKSWLEEFQYRIDLGVLTFLLSSLIIFAITAFVIGGQLVSAVRSNPVNALKNE